MKRFLHILTILVLLFGFAGSSLAQVPDSVSYQGYLEDAGLPVTATVTLTFRLYEASAGGSEIWIETQSGISVEDGVFSVLLGQVASLSLITFDRPLWLSIAIGDPTDPELSPRTLLASAPYAQFAEFARTAGSGSLWSQNGSDIHYVAGNVGIGTASIDTESKLHVGLPVSGSFANLQIESPSDIHGFGIKFVQPSQQWYVGQNIGNWDDGRFQIAPESNSKWLTLLENGNVGLTETGFQTPIARLQVPQNGDLNDTPSPKLPNAALLISDNATEGLAFDMDQIESVGNHLNLNWASDTDVLLAGGGGQVGVRVATAAAPLHVGEYKTVLFGADTLGKTNFFPDPKLMFLPGKGGAFRVGQLNADGSLIGGTGYDYWNTPNVGWASVAIGNNTKASGAGSVALGIRASATNFGSVALGHLSRTQGNSGVAAGYYTRADAFVSTAVGAGNVGGGSRNSWNSVDPIFEVGNSIDTTNRSNAFTVLKNGRVGINHADPQSMLDIEQPNQGPGNGVLLNLSGIGHWETGVDNSADYNFYFNNALKAYILDTDGTYIKTSDRRLKTNIQAMPPVLDTVLRLKPSTYEMLNAPPGEPNSYGFIAQDIEEVFPELVREKDGIKGLQYDGFGVLAIKAIQEMQALVDAQQDLIESLQRRVEELERR